MLTDRPEPTIRPARPEGTTRPDRPDPATPPARPDRVVVVVGTGTDVGKTWVAAALLRRLRAAGHPVWARKPAQSFEAGTDPAATDAAVLGRASGEAPETVCPPARWYPVAMAPPMATDVLGRPPVRLADLVAELVWPVPAGAAESAGPVGTRSGGSRPSVGLVETAGGVRSPQAHDGDAVDLTRLLSPDVVLLVADAGLGAVGAVRLCADALAGLVVVLNRFDPTDDLHRRNRDWLRHRDGLPVLVSPGDEDGLCGAVLG